MRRKAAHLAAAAAIAVAAVACLPIASAVPTPAPTAALPSPTASATNATSASSPTPRPSPLSPLDEGRIASGTFQSETLGREMPYLVYLPPGYDRSPDQRYPAVYMLHGMGGLNIEWLDYGFARTADRLMRAGEIPAFIIVFPQGDDSYWMDHAGGGPRWGTYTAVDVVAAIDARFRTLADRRFRAIGGLSMGADGALQLGLTFPSVFGIVGAHSPYLRREDEALVFFGKGKDYAERDPWSLARARPEIARTLALWIDVGDADERHAVVAGFHRELDQLGITHFWRELIGSHSEEYWGGYSPQFLRYYAAAFCGLDDDYVARRMDARAGSLCPPLPHRLR